MSGEVTGKREGEPDVDWGVSVMSTVSLVRLGALTNVSLTVVRVVAGTDAGQAMGLVVVELESGSGTSTAAKLLLKPGGTVPMPLSSSLFDLDSIRRRVESMCACIRW